jgi:tellurite methyltransferase
MSATDKDKWDKIYQSKQQTSEKKDLSPAYILQEFQHLLPNQGEALDLACGLGANALFLAQHNLQTHAWDVSSVAIDKLNQSAKSLKLKIKTEVRDVVTQPPNENSFDVIVISHFLERQIMPNIISALRDGGLLFYQTFTQARVDDTGPRCKKYRLAKNELLNLCEGLDVIVYREEGLIGDTTSGFRNQALFIGQRNIRTDTSVTNKIIDNMQSMLEQGKDNALLRFSLGNEYLKLKEYEVAIEHLARALKQDPDYSAAWKLYGKALTGADKNIEAIAAYKLGIEKAEKKGDIQAAKEMKIFLKRLL